MSRQNQSIAKKQGGTTVKKQHYVPQFYLGRFARANDPDQIFVYDKTTGKTYPSAIRDVASTSYFYDIPVDLLPYDAEDKKQIVEHTLSKLEGAYAIAVDKVLDTLSRKRRINQKQKPMIAEFLAVQALRTPDYRTTLIETLKKFDQAVTALGLRDAGDPSLNGGEVDPEDPAERENTNLVENGDSPMPFRGDAEPLHHARFMFDTETLGVLKATLRGHLWVVGVNKTDTPLYTSDNPVVKASLMPPSAYRTTGFGSPGVQIALPLTPALVLILVDRVVLRVREAERLENKTIALGQVDIDRLNSLQVQQSFRHVFSTVPNFELAHAYCEKYPQVRDSARERVQMHAPELLSPRAVQGEGPEEDRKIQKDDKALSQYAS